jgi:hypothetical protein
MQALDQIILDTLVEAATIAPYALIDYPNYLNPGAAAIGGDWPAAGFVDTEIRCLTELESWNAEKEVQPRVQA